MNWKELIRGLRQLGFKQREIASFCGCSQSAIAGLAVGSRGKRLDYEIGSRLIEMSQKAHQRLILPEKTASHD